MERETFLDKEVGYKYTTEERTITEEDLNTFYNLLEGKETIFTDDEFSRSLGLEFKGKIVPGLFILMMSGKLGMTKELAFDAVMLGMDNVKFLSPGYPGDRLRLEGELLTKRTTSKGHVLVSWQWTLKNQNDVVVATGVNTEMFSKEMVA